MNLPMKHIGGFRRDTSLEFHFQNHLVVAGYLAVRLAELVDQRLRICRIGEPFNRGDTARRSIACEAFHFAGSQRTRDTRDQDVHLSVTLGLLLKAMRESIERAALHKLDAVFPTRQ